MNNRGNSLLHLDYRHHPIAPYDDGSLNGIHISLISRHPGSTLGVAGAVGPFGPGAYVPPSALTRISSQPSMRNIGRNSNVQTDAHPRRRFSSQSSMAADPILMGDEQNKGLEKLRREIYNPGIQRVNLYYRDYDSTAKSQEKQNNNDGKKCVICLDDFEPREMVTLTPCHHMFHENCIVPWVKSHGQCPICRFVIIDWNKEHEGTQTSNNSELVNDPFARDLIYFIRGMEGRG